MYYLYAYVKGCDTDCIALVNTFDSITECSDERDRLANTYDLGFFVSITPRNTSLNYEDLIYNVSI